MAEPRAISSMQTSPSNSSLHCHQDAPGSEKPSLQDVVEKIGFGPAHLRFCLTGGGVYLADGAELLLITAVTRAVAEDWGLHPFQRGLAVTIVFVGVLIGNLICGPLGDAYGRRQMIITSYICIFIFSVLSSLVSGFGSFCAFRLLVGFSFGIGQPAWNALCTEVTPRYWRIAMNGLSQTLFVAGEIYSAALILTDDPQMEHLHWRRLLQLGAIPSALFAFAAAIFLLPSPSFLALRGDAEAAKKVLDVMKKDNRCDESVSTDFQVVAPVSMSSSDFGYQIRKLFSRHYWSSTVIVGLTCFGLNIVYYGCLYAFPQILPGLGVTAGWELLVGALWELPGNAFGILCGMCMPRKQAMKFYLFLMACCLSCFVMGVSMKVSAVTQALYHGGYYGIKFASCIGYIVTYQYAAELYPTEIRTTGASFCIGSGRLGAMLAPLVFEGVQMAFETYRGFFYWLIGFCVFNFFLIDFLPYETADMLLKDRLVGDTDSEDSEAYGTVNGKHAADSRSVPDLERSAAGGTMKPDVEVPR